jgi:hypothetical protein
MALNPDMQLPRCVAVEAEGAAPAAATPSHTRLHLQLGHLVGQLLCFSAGDARESQGAMLPAQ